MASSLLAPATVDYPSSDGQPVAETDRQRTPLTYAVDRLRHHFRDRPDVYVSGNLFIYYQKGNPRAVVAPDVFVVLGADNVAAGAGAHRRRVSAAAGAGAGGRHAGAGERSPRTGTAAHRTRATLSRSADRGEPVEPWRNRRRAAARRAGAARSGLTPCAGSSSPSAGGSSPTGRGGARGGAGGPAAPDPRQRFQRRPPTSVRDHFRNRLTALTNGKTLYARMAVSALGGTISRRKRDRGLAPSRRGLNMSIRLSIGPGWGPRTRKNERIRMTTRRSDSGAAVSRLTPTTNLRPAGRVPTPLRTPASHAITPRFLHQGLHLQPEPPPRPPAPRSGRRSEPRRAGVLTLWTRHARLSPVRDDCPARGWAGVLRAPLQQRLACELAKQSGWSPAGGKWDPCSIVNAATPRSVATDPRGRGFPAPYQTFLRKGEQT